MSAVSEKRVALIGAGRSGRLAVRALADVGECALSAVVDPDAAAARSAAAAVRVFPDVSALLRAGRVPDLAVICAPPGLHLELATPLLRCGADLLIRPPLAITRDDAERLTELAERLGRALLCTSALGASLRRLPAPGAELGRALRLEVELAHGRDARAGWRGDPALSGGGVLMDLGPPALDLAEIRLGPLVEIRMCESDHLQRGEVEDAVHLETAHRGGGTASLRLTWNEETRHGLARCSHERGDSSIPLDFPTSDHGAHTALLQELLALRRERDRICDEGARTLGWLHAAYRSRELGRWQYA
jgi:predicted dehydrogenase